MPSPSPETLLVLLALVAIVGVVGLFLVYLLLAGWRRSLARTRSTRRQRTELTDVWRQSAERLQIESPADEHPIDDEDEDEDDEADEEGDDDSEEDDEIDDDDEPDEDNDLPFGR